MLELLDVVNQQDEVIGQAERAEIYQKRLCHRIVHVLIFNSQNQMALQLRSDQVSFCPNHWSTAVGGHVQAGENYEEAALREFQEEVGKTSQIEFFSKDFYEAAGSPNKFLVTFKSQLELLDKIACPDVVQIKFFELAEIRQMIERGEKFHPELLFLLKKYF